MAQSFILFFSDSVDHYSVLQLFCKERSWNWISHVICSLCFVYCTYRSHFFCAVYMFRPSQLYSYYYINSLGCVITQLLIMQTLPLIPRPAGPTWFVITQCSC